MRVTISSIDGNIASVDVPDDMELENFLALSQSEIPSLAAYPVRQLGIITPSSNSGRFINDYGKSLKDCGVSDGDVVVVGVMRSAQPSQARTAQSQASGNPFNIDFSAIQVPGTGNGGNRRPRPPQQPGGAQPALTAASGVPGMPDPNALRQAILADPTALARVREGNPNLAAALDNPDEFARLVQEQVASRQAAALRRLQMLRDNPFDPEVQRMIEQEIQQQEIESHMETAIEHMPETFGIVTMLYIRCKVNGHEVKAFVDSGAQATIMSEPCARRCNITRLIDRRFSGIARGVGTSKIVGRIHLAQLQIENDYFPTAFNVLEDAGVEMLFGLDMLKRHQCVIDLQRNVLVITTTGTTTQFLPESELPEGRHHGPTSPGVEDRQLAEALDRSAAEAEAASLAASVAAANVRHSVEAPSGPQSSAAHTSAQGATTSTTTGSSNQSVDRLVAMGFRREDAERELANAGGNVDKAAATLIAAMLPPPPPAKKK